MTVCPVVSLLTHVTVPPTDTVKFRGVKAIAADWAPDTIVMSALTPVMLPRITPAPIAPTMSPPTTKPMMPIVNKPPAEFGVARYRF